MLNSISAIEVELVDIATTAFEELTLIRDQAISLESLLSKNNTDFTSPQSALRTKFNEESNKCLWYEMVSFLTDYKIDPKATEIEWNSVINSFLC